MEPGHDPRLPALSGGGAQSVERADRFDGSAVVDSVAKLTRSVPKIDLRVRANSWHWMAWADGYSWSGGTMCSLVQLGSATVSGLPSVSPSRMAWNGRQKS